MRRIALAAALLLVPGLAAAQEPPPVPMPAPPVPEAREGLGLVEQGMRLMMRGLADEVAPALDDLDGALGALRGAVRELDQYERPEVLPNGDILIRRKPAPSEAPAPPLPSPYAGPETDL